MRKFRIFALLAATTLVLAFAVHGQQVHTLVTYTFGTGSATEPDRSQAVDEATQSAQNWANSACIGTVTNTNTTSSNCFTTGSDEDNNIQCACTVSLKARCETEYRGR